MAKRNGKEGLKDEEKRSLNKNNLSKLAGIVRFMLPYKWIFSSGLVALVLSTLTLLAFPLAFGELLDAALHKSKYFSSVDEVTVALVAILIFQAVFSFIRVYTFSFVSEKGVANLRGKLYEKILWLPITYFDSRRVGELMSRLTADIALLQDAFSISLAEFIRQLFTIVGGIAIIVFIAPTLTGFMLLVFPAIIIAAVIFGKFIRKLSSQTQDKIATSNVIVEESLQSISIVKAFTNEIFEINRYRKALDEVASVALKSSRYRGFFISFIITAVFGGIVAVAWYGTSLIESGLLKPGQFTSFIMYTVMIGVSVGGLGEIFTQLQRSIGASERVLEILNEKDEATDSTQTFKLRGQVDFNQVTFAYPTRPDVTVLKHFAFNIRSGEKVALVGQSGSGKSTIINLLMRFYPIQEGNILVDGKPIEQYNLQGYRQNIGIVPQEVILFGGTIQENIAYGKPGASIEEIRDAARKANALEFIESFPEKFDTLVGDRGIKLSGGQRQRIAIARAILKDPVILVLDEATSSLDAQSEFLVQEALEKLMEGRTTIIIAHRLSTIKKVDRIFVLKDGQLAETGSHLELTNLDNGIYSNLLKLQLQ